MYNIVTDENQFIFTDSPANIMMKQSAYVTTVTLFFSSVGPSSSKSSLVFVPDMLFPFHSFLKNLKPNTSRVLYIHTHHTSVCPTYIHLIRSPVDAPKR